MKRPTPFLLPLLLLGTSVSAACATGEDPCAIEASGVDLSSSSLKDLGVSDDKLACTGRSDGQALQCADAAQLVSAVCSDGFGVTLDSGNVRLLIRLRGGDRWTAGAKLEGGEVLGGSLTMAGLPSPLEPVATAGSEQAGSFFLLGENANFDGTMRLRW